MQRERAHTHAHSEAARQLQPGECSQTQLIRTMQWNAQFTYQMHIQTTRTRFNQMKRAGKIVYGYFSFCVRQFCRLFNNVRRLMYSWYERQSRYWFSINVFSAYFVVLSFSITFPTPVSCSLGSSSSYLQAGRWSRALNNTHDHWWSLVWVWLNNNNISCETRYARLLEWL